MIGTFGFLLPGKGLTELIYSFALILKAYPAAYLLMINADYPNPESQEQRELCLALVRLLEIEGHVRLVNEFLDIDETLFLLSACEAIVFPYQRSKESASGAVRLGLAAGRPVLVTPLPVFSDLSEVVYQLPGTEPREIAEGILSLLRDDDQMTEVLQRQRDWVRANGWAAQAARMSNIIHGCFEDTEGVTLRVSRRAGSGMVPPLEKETRTQADSSSLRATVPVLAEDALDGDAVSWKDGAPRPLKAVRSFLRRLGSRSPNSTPNRADDALISRADRARDQRDWVSAARYYRRALDQEPINPPIWVQYGHALKESGSVLRPRTPIENRLSWSLMSPTPISNLVMR